MRRGRWEIGTCGFEPQTPTVSSNSRANIYHLRGESTENAASFQLPSSTTLTPLSILPPLPIEKVTEKVAGGSLLPKKGLTDGRSTHRTNCRAGRQDIRSRALLGC